MVPLALTGYYSLSPDKVAQVLTWFSIGALVMAVAFPSIAVNWHRFVLLGEWPRGLNLLRVDRPVWRYLGNLILIGLLASLIVLVPFAILGLFFGIGVDTGNFVVGPDVEGGTAANTESSRYGRFDIWSAVAAGLFGGVYLRFALKLPAVALGRRDFGISASWRRTKGRFGFLAAVSCVIFGVTVLADTAVEKLSLLAAGFEITGA